jgi:hypothetical protein
MVHLIALAAFAQDAPVDAPAPSDPPASWQTDRLGWGALPAVNFSSDEGFGAGALGGLYRYDGQTNPYKWALTGIGFLTTRGIHNHWIQLDALRIGGSPLRITTRASFLVTRVGNYCGYGHEVTCDPADAEAAADDVGLTGATRAEFVKDYHRVRFVRPFAFVNARWELDPMPHRVEVFGGWRVEILRDGDLSEGGPFPGSLYDVDTDGGDDGVLSVLQAGVMFDDRDKEAAPSRGYWAEASVRGAAPFLGSTWSYAGVNLTFRGYQPLLKDRSLVFAARWVFDGRVGDGPLREWANPGGSTLYEIYGSLNSGRGIRARRYVGDVVTFVNPELRWTFLTVRPGKTPIAFTALTFADTGFVADRWADLGSALTHPLVGTGGGLRVAFDDNFIVRADVGVSPIEGWSPYVYLDINNLF